VATGQKVAIKLTRAGEENEVPAARPGHVIEGLKALNTSSPRFLRVAGNHPKYTVGLYCNRRVDAERSAEKSYPSVSTFNKSKPFSFTKDAARLSSRASRSPESASLVAGLPRPLPFKRHEGIFVFPNVWAFYFYPRIVAMIYLSSARSLSGSMQRKVQRVGQRYSMLAAESPMFAPTSIETANNAGDVRTFINNF